MDALGPLVLQSNSITIYGFLGAWCSLLTQTIPKPRVHFQVQSHRTPQASLILAHPSKEGHLTMFFGIQASDAPLHHHGDTMDEVAATFVVCV